MNTPINSEVVSRLIKKANLPNIGDATIRELVRLVSEIEAETGDKFVRMEMGVPGLPAPEVGVNAEIEALKSGVASKYAALDGLPILKQEISRFVKLFLDVDVEAKHCVPTVGAMQGAMVSFLVVNRTNKDKEGTLFIDPGFPVQKMQCKVLGHNYETFDVYNYRGEKLRDKLESYLKTGKFSSLLYSNPNNPSWICFTDEELKIIGELATKYDTIVIEDLAYFGMDFRHDYSKPGEPPYQPTVAKYTGNWIYLISASKSFSYAGQRIGMAIISPEIFYRPYPDLKRYYSTDQLGYSFIYGALYTLSAGVSHSTQYALYSMLKAVNDGVYNFRDDILVYGERAKQMKKLFTDNGFKIVYDKDVDNPLADGFYFTISYPGMEASELLEKLLYYGISAISLKITGSYRTEGLRACVSQVHESQLKDLKYRLEEFNKRYSA